jgi:hypothetical protein
LYWLLNGKGTFPKSEKSQQPITPPKQKSVLNDFESSPLQDLFSSQDTPSNSFEKQIIPKHNIVKGKAIAKIIVLYTDGSFESFEN